MSSLRRSASRSGDASKCSCLSSVLLAVMGLVAWLVGLQTADRQAWQRQLGTRLLDSVGVSGFVPSTSIGMDYTIQQQDYFLDSQFIMARYMYFWAAAMGPIAVSLVLFSSWPGIISQSRRTSQRRLALLCFTNSLALIGIVTVIYFSQLCREVDEAAEDNFVKLHFRDNVTLPYATTASVGEDIAELQCIPSMEGYLLVGSSVVWLFIAIVFYCTAPKGDDEEEDGLVLVTSESLSREPLLDPPARTLGWIAFWNIFAIFALFPYWQTSTLIEMSPQLPHFARHEAAKGALANLENSRQVLGPFLFNPPQNIGYDTEQGFLVEEAFLLPNQLAWIPLAINTMGLPVLLYGRHRLTHVQQESGSMMSIWPFALLVILFVAGALATISVPASIMFTSELCNPGNFDGSDKYPEFTFREVMSSEGGWRGTGIHNHSTMAPACWPDSNGQILMLGAAILLLQAVMLVMYSLQYSDALDTLETLEGIDQDVERRQLLTGKGASSDEGEDDSESDAEDGKGEGTKGQGKSGALGIPRPEGLRKRSRSDELERLY